MADSPRLRRYATFVVRHRWAVIAFGVITTAILASGLLRLRIEVDPDRALPQDHPYIVNLNELHRLFGDKNMVVIGLTPREGGVYSPAFLGKVWSLTRRLEQIPGAVRPLLQSIASPAMKDVQPTGDGIVVEPLMEEPPRTTAEADAIRERVRRNPAFRGTLVAADDSALAIYATFELSPVLPGYVNLHQAVMDAVRAEDDGTFTYALSGPVVIVSALTRYSEEMAYLFPIALLVIALVHFDAFRTLQATFLPLLTAILSVTWAVGFMGLLRVPLDSFNSTTPILILAIAAGHAVQLLKRYYEELERLRDSRAAVIESIARIGGVMIAASVIAALAFASLVTFGTASIRTFGVFTALGIVSTLVIELTIIPALRASLPAPRLSERQHEAAPHPWIDAGLRRLAKVVCGPGARSIVIAAIAVIGVSIGLAQRLQVDTSFKKYLPPGDPVRRDDESLNRTFAGTSNLIFLVEGPEEGAIADPAALRAIRDFQRRAESLPDVGKTLSIVDRVEILHRALAPDRATDGLPDSKALAIQYLFLYSLSGGDDLSTQISADNRVAKVTVLLRNDSTEFGRAMIENLAGILGEELPTEYRVRVAGSLASDGALTDTMVKGKAWNILQIGALTIVVAAVLLRSVLCGILVALPLAFAVAVNFGVMGVLGIRLDIGTSAIAAMAVGIGADYAIYYLFRLREEYRASGGDFDRATEQALATSGKAILFVSSAIAIGYLTLCLSGFRLYVQLGALVALAMVTSSVATLTVLAALASLVARTRWSDVLLGTASSPEVDESPYEVAR